MSATDQDKLNAIRLILFKKYDVPLEAITLESTLDDLGLDSLTSVELAFDIEDQFKIRMEDDPKIMGRTLRELIDAIDKATAFRAAA
jgi:acyl carrier protein